MVDIALVATDLFLDKRLSNLSINKSLNCNWISDVYTLSNQPFFPGSKNIPLHSSLTKERITSYKMLLASGGETHYIFTNWDSFINLPTSWESRYASFDFIGTPVWVDDNAYLLHNLNFCLISRKLLLALIADYENSANIEFSDYWSNYALINLTKKFNFKSIIFADQATSQSFCYESGKILKNTFGVSGSANFPYFLLENDLLPIVDEIIARQLTPLTTLNYLRYCLESQKLDLFKATIRNYNAKPNLKKAVEFELQNNPLSELPSIIEKLNQ